MQSMNALLFLTSCAQFLSLESLDIQWAAQLRPRASRLTLSTPKSEKLVSNASSASASSSVAPDLYYYITDKHVLMRVETGKPPIRLAENVIWSSNGYDDSLWYSDSAGTVWRLRYNRNAQKVPNVPEGVILTRFAPRSYHEIYAVTTKGDLYHFVEYDWLRDPSARNVKDVGVGVGGSLMYVDGSNVIHYWDYAANAWKVYEHGGAGFDLFDSQHVVVLDDKGRAHKKTDGGWVEVEETCKEVFVMESYFFCVNFNKDLKLVKY